MWKKQMNQVDACGGSHIQRAGYDVISDHAFINVASLQEAERLCQASNEICKQHKNNIL